MTETPIVTALWRRIDQTGHDAACLRPGRVGGRELEGQAVFADGQGPVALHYLLELADDWSTLSARVAGFVGNRAIDSHAVRTPRGWTLDGRDFGMAELVDLDLGFTPATNMVQLKRAALAVGKTAGIDVAWLDAGASELVRLPQVYRRVAASSYAYAAPTVGYAGQIRVADNGFAADYPGLWEMLD